MFGSDDFDEIMIDQVLRSRRGSVIRQATELMRMLLFCHAYCKLLGCNVARPAMAQSDTLGSRFRGELCSYIEHRGTAFDNNSYLIQTNISESDEYYDQFHNAFNEHQTWTLYDRPQHQSRQCETWSPGTDLSPSGRHGRVRWWTHQEHTETY